MSGGGLTPDKIDQLRRLFRNLQVKIKQQTVSPKPDAPRKSSMLERIMDWSIGGVVGNISTDLVPENLRNAIKRAIYSSPPTAKNPDDHPYDDHPYIVSLSNLDDAFAALDLLVDSRAVVQVFPCITFEHRDDDKLPPFSGDKPRQLSVEILCYISTAAKLKLAFAQAATRRAPEPEDSRGYSRMEVLTRAQAEQMKADFSYILQNIVGRKLKPN